MQMTKNCFLSKVLTAIVFLIRKGLKILVAGGHYPLKDVLVCKRCIQQPKDDDNAPLFELERWLAEKLHLEKAPTAMTNS